TVLVACQEGDLVLVAETAEFDTELQRVRALDPGQIVANLEDVVEYIARMTRRAGSSQEAGDLELRDAAQAVNRRSRKARETQVFHDLISLLGQGIVIERIVSVGIAGAKFIDQVWFDDPVVRSGKVQKRGASS